MDFVGSGVAAAANSAADSMQDGPLPSERIQRWRRRADELRALADQARDADARRTLMQLADNWDEIAVRTERAEDTARRPSLRI
jgi:hypothetical protein